MLKFILSFLLITNICLAQDVKYVEKDQVVPYTGYLFTPKKELEVRLKYIEFQTLEQKLALQQDIMNIMEARLKNHTDYISSLEKSRNNSSWKETGYFLLGALLTGYIAANVSR
jgi:hypothetical protein